jgi:N6-adenosine-specific RNA methylase IME4
MILANLKFDVIIIGSLSETQFIVPLLINLPLSKLCSKPGFLFIWASASQIKELSNILNNQKFSNWNNFRKSEELIFIPVDNTTTRSDNDGLLDNNQWHCWMCITGTVRRSVDNHLIHCNIDTDLKIESEEEAFNSKTSTPEFIYKIAENFSSGNRRLHIIPSRSGSSKYIKPREGWCVISPDIILDNFTIEGYQSDISRLGLNVKYGDEIEKIRPKSPKRYNNNQNNHR